MLDAGKTEFAQHGFAETRIEDIAALAGLSKTGVYAHYDSAVAILGALALEYQAPPPWHWPLLAGWAALGLVTVAAPRLRRRSNICTATARSRTASNSAL
ncbi:helix-turn-helix domain-containing protein [Xanthomonas hortorum]|uniref:TetR/AcrR family transcriptional regulator n=1 Tax=Xanthomonas hortorum pv. hederae TaxID=453603 RepID=A0A9X4H5W4_9XANT|nr:helix-turn-helix domain-containing protein [Xanthomonas hortorum]MDC8639834.1 TetR/AcrR family transcriptional regulator [Xanthomonas hortorum pv. hederae]